MLQASQNSTGDQAQYIQQLYNLSCLVYLNSFQQEEVDVATNQPQI